MITAMDEPRPAGAPAPAPEDPASPLSTPLRAQIEQACRGLPATPEQCHWAMCRPARHRVKPPMVGDEVLYRHNNWEDPEVARVVWVQPTDDVDDPHVMQVQQREGRPVLLDGRPVFVTNPDAWLRVHLRTSHGIADTREARLPGSPGWLPLDWQNRFRPMPWEV